MASPLAWTAAVAEIQKEHVILEFKDGQRLSWPRHLLPGKITAGSQVWLAASTHPVANEHRHHLGRTLLNELLHGA